MPPKKKQVVKVENDVVIDAAKFKALEDRLKNLTKQYEALSDDFQKVLNENKELKTQVVKIAVVDTHVRFVRKIDIIKVLKMFNRNEPDLKDFEIAITDKNITLKVVTMSGNRFELPLSEAQKYQL